MDFYPVPTDHQGIFADGVKQVFNGLGKGYLVVLYESGGEPYIRLLAAPGKYYDFDGTLQQMECLIEKGLAQERTDGLPSQLIHATKRYVLTEVGRALFNELDDLSDVEFAKKFEERVRPRLSISGK